MKYHHPQLVRLYVEPLLMIPYYLFGLLIGVIIYRRSNVVKDFEYRRSKVMKKMKSAYTAEENGVWQTNAEVPSGISKETNLSSGVSQISLEAPEMEPLGPKSAVRIIRFSALSISVRDWVERIRIIGLDASGLFSLKSMISESGEAFIDFRKPWMVRAGR